MCTRAGTHGILQGYKNFCFMFHTCNLVHVLSMEFIPYKLFNMLNIFFWNFFRMFEKARDCTLKKGTWFVAWSQSVRVLHQRTYMWRWILGAIVRSKSTRFLIHNNKWSVAQTWSVWMLEYHKKRGIFKLILNILRLYLSFHCMHVKLKLIPKLIKIPNLSLTQDQIYSQKMQNKSMYRVHISSVKDVKRTQDFETF